ncbi:MAG: SET domain-containing protein-lysine N-methyltransferase [Betaproteobacteria bacterium]|nr:SET domain-containing protein-lysine N-methyltransferase [Betaproteobacteria bacterium]MDH3437217.1 SET domain-containing protein-lysine N-methyltransferase [Betaproteobacteria bacterium]
MARTQSKGGRRISVRRSPIHGRGVFALKKIRKGERIIEYTGERITHREADRRYPNDDSSHTMLFIVDKKIVIDATRVGNSARWINHSCRPNCESVDEDKRMYIEATRDIRKGEELSYDYNLVLEERHTPAAKKENPCLCGAKRCRGTLLGSKR